MILYTCRWQKRSAGWHPCGVAAKALDEAGHGYEIKVVSGQVSMPWTWPTRRRDRAEVRALSGKNGVPLLVLDDGDCHRRFLADRALGTRTLASLIVCPTDNAPRRSGGYCRVL